MRSGRCVDGCSQLQGRPNYNFITKSLQEQEMRMGACVGGGGCGVVGGMVGEAELDPRLIERTECSRGRASDAL